MAYQGHRALSLAYALLLGNPTTVPLVTRGVISDFAEFTAFNRYLTAAHGLGGPIRVLY
jgi:hypothetical protein